MHDAAGLVHLPGARRIDKGIANRRREEKGKKEEEKEESQSIPKNNGQQDLLGGVGCLAARRPVIRPSGLSGEDSRTGGEPVGL